MAIDIKPLSITAMLNGIKSFFQSQENNSKWKDLNTGAEGNFLMRLLANIVSVISSRVVTGRREQHHDTANFMSSQIALAVDNGYPVFRGLNQRRTIKLLANTTRTIPALSVIGFYGTDYSIITLEQLTLVEGEETEPFKVVIGALKEIQWQAKTSSLKKFVRHEQGISEDYVLYLDGTPVETTKHAKDKIADKYYIYTNHYKSVTVEYLNNMPNATHKYDSDTVFTLRYVELDDVESIQFSSEMFNVGELVNTITIEPFKPFEDIEDIKHNSPVYRETQNLIRAKADWRDMYKDSLPAFKEVTFRALTPSYTQVSYIKDDYTLLSSAEEASIRENVEPGRYFGRPFPDVEDPKREITTLDITLGLSSVYTDEDDVKADVSNIVQNMYKSQFKQKLNIYDVEEQLKALTYVKYARVTLHSEPREPLGTYRLGNMITETSTYTDANGATATESKTYKCTAILGRAGTVEPSWQIPTTETPVEEVETGIETIDNELVWACYKRMKSMDLPVWTSDGLYAIGDFVYSESLPNFMFKCVDFISYSASSAPDTTDIKEGDFLEDGNLLLVCVPYNAEYQDRVSTYSYRLRNRIKFNGLAFEVVGHIGTAAGTSTLQFTDAIQELYVNDIVEPGNLYLDGDFRPYISQGDTLQVSMVSTRAVPYDEVSEVNLTRTAVINAKVKDYEDEDVDPSTTTVINTTATSTTVNIDLTDTMLTATGHSSPEEEPNLNEHNIGDTITDFELVLEVIPYDAALPVRVSGHEYSIGDKFRLAGSTAAALEVIAFTTSSSSSGSSSTSTSTGTSSTTDIIPPAPVIVQNANWKELEKVKAQMEQIQKWIESEPSDTLKTPADVIAFYRSLGDGSRFTEEELNMLEAYYVEYNAYDEEQIYLHMDQFGSTRKEAIEELKAASQLSAPISNANCIKLLDSDGNIVYVDRYGTATYAKKYSGEDEQKIYAYEVQNNKTRAEAIAALSAAGKLTSSPTDPEKLSFEVAYVAGSPVYAISRENTNFESVKITSHIYGADDTVEYNSVQEDYVKTFMITVKSEPQYNNYAIIDKETGELSKMLTCIIPVSPVSKYNKGSYINLSYSTTKDGRVRWDEVDDMENVTYAWNVYPNVEVNVSLKY